MEQKLTQAVMAILIALMAWNFKTVNELQLSVEAMMYTHGKNDELQELKLEVERMKWILHDDAVTK